MSSLLELAEPAGSLVGLFLEACAGLLELFLEACPGLLELDVLSASLGGLLWDAWPGLLGLFWDACPGLLTLSSLSLSRSSGVGGSMGQGVPLSAAVAFTIVQCFTLTRLEPQVAKGASIEPLGRVLRPPLGLIFSADHPAPVLPWHCFTGLHVPFWLHLAAVLAPLHVLGMTVFAQGEVVQRGR